MESARHLTVITGASRGLGRGIADALINRAGQYVIGISRKSDPALTVRAKANGVELEQWTHDLADSAPLARRLAQRVGGLDAASFDTATLINNAGVMAPPRPLENADLDDLIQSVRVGLEAPMLLSAAFLRATCGWTAKRRILQISSGLGRVPRGGQAPYCAVKAGLDHFARALALEHGVRSVSLAPGIVDTDMQAQLRQADPDEFPEVARFHMLKTKGLLDSPEVSAGKVLAWLDRDDFGNEPVVDLMQPLAASK